MSMPAIEGGMRVLGTFLKETEGFTTRVMSMSPINSLLMINLLGNLGYALTTEKMLFEVNPVIGPEEFETRQELIAAVFKNTAEKSGELMTSGMIKEIMSGFNLANVIGALSP